MNQFEKLVRIVKSDKEKRKLIVLSLGYKNISKGCNKLLTNLRKKSISIYELEKLSEILSFDIQEVISDYIKMKEDIKKEKNLLKKIDKLKKEIHIRGNFKPYIYIETSLKSPTFITGANIFGKDIKYIKNLQENILELSREEQIEIIKNISKNHYYDSNGSCNFFGKITGYRYFYKYNESLDISI